MPETIEKRHLKTITVWRYAGQKWSVSNSSEVHAKLQCTFKRFWNVKKKYGCTFESAVVIPVQETETPPIPDVTDLSCGAPFCPPDTKNLTEPLTVFLRMVPECCETASLQHSRKRTVGRQFS